MPMIIAGSVRITCLLPPKHPHCGVPCRVCLRNGVTVANTASQALRFLALLCLKLAIASTFTDGTPEAVVLMLLSK